MPMNKFVFSGVVVSNEEKTYGDGSKSFVELGVVNGNTKIEIACFADNKGVAKLAKQGRTVKLTGALGSRDYTDKNGKARSAVQLRLSEGGVELGAEEKAPTPEAAADDAFNNIPF